MKESGKAPTLFFYGRKKKYDLPEKPKGTVDRTTTWLGNIARDVGKNPRASYKLDAWVSGSMSAGHGVLTDNKGMFQFSMAEWYLQLHQM